MQTRKLPTSKSIFRIDNTTLSEKQKVTQRQQSLRSVLPQELSPLDLFSYHFNPEIIGKRNCENLIGSVEIPVGLVGPVQVTLDTATIPPQLYIPLATTEGALVASTARGCKAITKSGGAQVIIQNRGMTRAPLFKCQNIQDAHTFVDWLNQTQQLAQLKKYTQATSNHLKYLSHTSFIRGRHVYTRFHFDTDRAMGMNMVTIALQEALPQILQTAPVSVELIAISSNLCTDKKAATINTLLGRGYWTQAEVKIPFSVLESVLKIPQQDAHRLIDTHVAKNLVGSNLAGSHSQNMQAANIIAAFFAATGQDLGHVGEASQVSSTFELDSNGVYCSVTIPDLPLGTVGGGTSLPSQEQARSLITRHQAVTPQTLAAAVAVAVLAAEISGLAALTTQTLAQAHQKLGRLAKAK